MQALRDATFHHPIALLARGAADLRRLVRDGGPWMDAIRHMADAVQALSDASAVLIVSRSEGRRSVGSR